MILGVLPRMAADKLLHSETFSLNNHPAARNTVTSLWTGRVCGTIIMISLAYTSPPLDLQDTVDC